MLTILAPAKLNLTLEVLAKRRDGFHEVRSVMQSISLCDSLSFHLSRGIQFSCDLPNWVAEESLVPKVVSLIQRVTGCTKGARIEVSKRIPLVSGLGGDSSDAAATLRGLDKLWGLGLSQEELLQLAAELGSDVPFFLCGGTALAEGRGEIITPLPPLPHMWVVLVVPHVPPRLPKKTEQLYARLDASHYSDGKITEGLVERLREGRDFTSSLLFNTFENITFAWDSELHPYREHILSLGAANVHLAGSGPTLFTLVKDRAEAEDLYARCQQQNMETYLIEPVGPVP